MLKHFFRDSIIYGGANFLSRGIGFFLIPIYTRVFSPEDFGVIDFIATFAAIISVTIPLGISNGIARYLPETESMDAKSAYASSALWFTVISYAIFGLIAFLFTDLFTSLLLNSIKWRNVFQIAVIAIIFSGVLYFFQTLLRVQLNAKAYVLSSFLVTMGTAGATIVLIVLGTDVAAVFYGQIVGALAGGVIAWHFSRKQLKFFLAKANLSKMLVFSLPLVPALLGEFFANYIDRIAIRKLMTMSDLGIYGIGYRFASVVNLLMMGFNYALMPLIYNNYRKPETPNELAKIFSYFLALAIPFILAISMFSREVLILFTTRQYYSASHLIPLLSMAIMFYTMYNFMPGLGISMKTWIIALIHLATALAGTILNFILIPRLGIKGAALATLFSSMVCFLSYLFFSQKYYPVPHKWYRIVGAMIVGVVAYGVDGSLVMVSFLTQCQMFLKLIIIGLSSFFVAWILVGSNDVRLLINKALLKVAA